MRSQSRINALTFYFLKNPMHFTGLTSSSGVKYLEENKEHAISH